MSWEANGKIARGRVTEEDAEVTLRGNLTKGSGWRVGTDHGGFRCLLATGATGRAVPWIRATSFPARSRAN